MSGMRTSTAYDIRGNVNQSSEKSDTATRRIRAALTIRGTSLHAWVRDWAVSQGRDPEATYETARKTLSRCVERGIEPRGQIGRVLIAALVRELGSDVVWPDRDQAEQAS